MKSNVKKIIPLHIKLFFQSRVFLETNRSTCTRTTIFVYMGTDVRPFEFSRYFLKKL